MTRQITASQDTGERLARIETKVEHISVSQDRLSEDHAAAKSVAEMTLTDLKESILQLRINSETQLRSLEAAHKRMDGNDERLNKLSDKVDCIEDEVKAFKTRVTLLLTIGAGAVSVFWAILGPTVQGYAGRLLGS